MKDDFAALLSGMSAERLSEITAEILATLDPERVVELAAKEGLSITVEDASQIIEELRAAESEVLSLNDLENVSGGASLDSAGGLVGTAWATGEDVNIVDFALSSDEENIFPQYRVNFA